jgi:CubicO group peptidase (beta-lactamase class C family)
MRVISAAVFACFLCFPLAARAADPLPRAKAEEVGMSSERLALIGKAVNDEVTRGQLPGAVVAVARRGKLVYFEAFGYSDKQAGTPMTTDSIFSIASMTKPVVAVAALQLYEQGRLLMSDPLDKYFPKFANRQVAVADATGEVIVERIPAGRQITIQDLLRHTSGLSYGSGSSAVHKMYPTAADVGRTTTAAEFLERLSSLPLAYQPGTVWEYGFGLDVLGLIIESLTDQTLGNYLQARIFKPLGMNDTGVKHGSPKRHCSSNGPRARLRPPNSGSQPSTAKCRSVASSISPSCAGASSAIIKTSSRKSASGIMRAAAGGASTITARCQSQPTVS